jgi:hypothetical protein
MALLRAISNVPMNPFRDATEATFTSTTISATKAVLA